MQNAHSSRRQRVLFGCYAGLVAGLVASLLMVLFSMLLGTVSLPELLGSSITQAMSPTTFQSLHELFGPDAKHYLFYIIVAGQCLIFALSGGLCNLVLSQISYPSLVEDEQGTLRWPVGLWLAGILWLLTGLLFLPLTGAGFFGASLAGGVFSTMFTLAVVGLFFGLFFVFVQNWLLFRHLQHLGVVEREEALQAGLTRRAVLVRGGVWIGVAALGVLAWRFISQGTSGGQTLSSTSLNHLQQDYKPRVDATTPTYSNSDFSQIPGLSSEITPNDQFYGVSKNLASDPDINAVRWNMTIVGQVEHPYALNYAELQTLPMKTQYETLMCISNEVGGQYISNAAWKGVPLADLLAKAGRIKPGATKVVLYADDGYSDSIHLAKALEPTTLVALYMNGVALPPAHGYPARLLVPGIYGMKHVKWITKIEVVNTNYQGYWQGQGWSDPAPVRMTSRIDTPISSQQLKAGTPTYIAGVAFSGDKGISMVDISLDAGETWQHTLLKKPLSDLTWVLWEMPWQPKAGSYTLVVRAIDLEGNVQDPAIASPAPDGSSGYHSIMVTVA